MSNAVLLISRNSSGKARGCRVSLRTVQGIACVMYDRGFLSFKRSSVMAASG